LKPLNWQPMTEEDMDWLESLTKPSKKSLTPAYA